MAVGTERISLETANFVSERYGEEITARLVRIANILSDKDVETELAGEIGGLIGEVASFNFIAGVEFGELNPEVAEKIKRRIR